MSHGTPSNLTNGEGMILAPLQTLDLSCLASKEPSEICKLLKSCETHGFFYLDLHTTDEGRQILASEKDVMDVMRNYFDQPLETKMMDHRGSALIG